MDRRSGDSGLFWTCSKCWGSASTIQRMRRYVPRDVVNSLWNSARAGSWPRKRACPSCKHKMAQLPVSGDSFCLDICTTCAWVWFDAEEYELMPKTPVAAAEKKLPPQAARILALEQVKQIRRQAVADKSSPDEAWKYIPALLGVPVEFDCEPVRRPPYATLLLVIVISMVSLLGFAGLLKASAFGLVPDQWSRMGGATLLTAFFLHGGLRHLLGNLYFLFVFGDNVEDFLGRSRFLLLLFASTLAGGILYVLMHQGSSVPCIGASGGISGILTYYALRFPKHRIGFLIFFYKWICFPVIGYLAFWILMQFFGVFSGGGHVAYMAHLGGMLAGLTFWLVERFSQPAA